MNKKWKYLISKGIDGQYIPPASIQFWADGTDQSSHTAISEDKTLRSLDTITDKSTNAYAVQRVSTTTSAGDHMSYNGEAVYSDLNSEMSVKSNKSAFNFMHKGAAFTLYALIKPFELDALNLVSTALSSGNVGFSFKGRLTNTLQFFIANGGSVPINLIGSNNDITLDQYVIIKVTYDGVNLAKMYADGVEIASQTVSLGFSVADHTNDLKMEFDEMYCKHFMLYNELLSTEDQTSVEGFLATSKSEVVIESDANLYIIAGQSNAHGRGLDANITPSLDVTIEGGYGYDGNYGSSANFFNKIYPDIDFGQTSLEHGFWQKFAFDMTNDGDLFIQTRAASGTDLEVDWLPPSGAQYALTKGEWDNHLFRELKHVWRKNPVIRGLIWMQGEADATDTGPEYANYYQANLETLIKAVADDITAAGYSTAKMRVTILRIRDQAGTFDATSVAAVRTAQDYVGGNFLTDFPAYSTKVKSTRSVSTDTAALQGDNLHYSAAGLEAIGLELYDYYKNYISE